MVNPDTAADSSSASFEAAYERANALLYRHTSQAAIALRALLEQLEATDRLRRARVLERLCIAYRILGHYDEASAIGGEALKLCEALGDDAALSRILVALGNISWCQGLLLDALAHYESALEIRQNQNDLPALAGALGSVANILSELSRLTEARAHYELALAICQRTGDQRFAARTHNNLGECLLELDETEAALHHCETALKMCKALGDRSDEPNVLINLGRIRTRRMEWQLALDLLDEAAAAAVIGEDRRTEAVAMMYRARLTEDRSRREPQYAAQAELFRQEALKLAEAVGATAVRRQLHEDSAIAADRAGRKADAQQHWAQVKLLRAIESAEPA